ncbi:fused ferrous iron transporter, protein B: GTP-binding protein; membrane protein [Hyella patelloides LEGE 07179]|uniref:Ferrous iron transport protein B n=1 Tax=Hyella patelloides LEGE 07179 TaxID=945734 RepID=A0A563VN74_9CYAN|nr:Fe(2+) transporter permease subunit FeoB [Hyella patelloides]VEP12793.1 fused ferrous iron transporter, protein B: GTP-binding protein; membrane protein [Hyella patelloides LEGE 07179]
MKKQTIALIGNPNCGKTTLFNDLTGANQRTGNWPGVTVDRKEGKYSYDNVEITVIDLPGVYSLDAEDEGTGLDELIARDYLLEGEADLIINIVDASNLERNLYLTTQIMEMRVPMVTALNMIDIARERELDINTNELSQRLGCLVIPISAFLGEGITLLKSKINELINNPGNLPTVVAYPAVIEDTLSQIEPLVQKKGRNKKISTRWFALKLLEYEDRVAPELKGKELDRIVIENRRKIHQLLHEDIDIIVADSRYGFIRNLIQSSVRQTRDISTTTSDKIDQFVLNRWIGIPLFLVVMYLMFFIAINVGGAFIDFFDISVGTVFVDAPQAWLESLNAPGWFIGFITSIGGGIQTVATFIPQIGLLFVILSILEDSGYMARAAFVMDKLMRLVGLPGKSFVPMLVGFGCNVPAIMATRTLENRRDRLMTIMMNPFMSCGARLPVYALFAAAFFPRNGQNLVFGLYLIGIAAAIFTGLVMKNTIMQGEASPFVMELPPYHIPKPKGIAIRAWDRLRGFIIRAGKIIVLMVMVLSLLNSIGTDGSFGQQDSKDSILSATSQAVTPLFAPMGVSQENWPATVGIFTGVFAKEAMVGTIDSLYSQLAIEESEEVAEESGFDFWGGIGEAFSSIPANLADIGNQILDPVGLNIGNVEDQEAVAEEQELAVGTFGQMSQRFSSPTAAFAYLLFVLMYFPCVAATGAVYRETNLGWTLLVALWTTGLGYWVAVMFYQIATFSQHPGSSLSWTIGGVVTMAGTIFLFKLAQSPRSISLDRDRSQQRSKTTTRV